MIFKKAEIAIDPIAKPKKADEGTWEVRFYNRPGKRSSVDSPRETLVLYGSIFNSSSAENFGRSPYLDALLDSGL